MHELRRSKLQIPARMCEKNCAYPAIFFFHSPSVVTQVRSSVCTVEEAPHHFERAQTFTHHLRSIRNFMLGQPNTRNLQLRTGIISERSSWGNRQSRTIRDKSGYDSV